ncbi:S-formylglutathione hydrolase [Asticcacaulis sp. DW145]|uniref:S-formylglutathione hydrolase n=1 Tax=Asticcacaulis currens TaxID=2984210 RepID=A0ABT5IIC5_9CAUL|nr:S-formylglutathione hydrolase [Asticcacaulis currens]MDC7695948.1 S-formylglutathione hydrolase [Asticcacaulis currens]BEV12587.1 S-formylglutathione hydrolase [Asticcacaulis sp. DW145]
MDITAQHRLFGGTLSFVKHDSAATQTPMALSVFVPEGEGPFPVLIWLSGLTCTANNFTEKAGAYKRAAELGLMIVAPDTSPRGEGVANDEAYDLGQGAGFYVNATQSPWAAHFQMETYVTHDLLELIAAEFPADMSRVGLSGHSMGGHGALTLAMNYPHLFKSVSAFAPIASPVHCPWGQKAMTAYLGPSHEAWERSDAALRLARGKALPFDEILVDQGLADPFLETQLMPHLLEQAAKVAGQKLTLRRHEGYDHSYYFIASFIDDHLDFHTRRLKA